MRDSRIGVRFPLLSSVFFPPKRSAVLGLAVLRLSSPAHALDDRTERMIGPGVKCITLTRDTGPWVIHVIEADGVSGYVRPGLTYASSSGLRARAANVRRTTHPPDGASTRSRTGFRAGRTGTWR